ncbi:MFS transporter [Streptomyces sp. CA-250714]|uniref:MFS transporter n=1 Tax=Streptomyces sp. CA-250714 TaxID=3240060 RepID=UPI003D8F32BF
MRLISLLAVGAFALGLDAYVTAGLLPDVAGDLGSSIAAAGQMVTAFTLAYALASPLLAALLPAQRQRAGLLGALGLFTLANAGSALAPTLGVLLLSRAVAGVGAGVYLALAAASAASVTGPEHRGRALAMLMGGMSGGTVVGVPVGVLVAEHAGWRSTLWLVTALGAAAFGGLVARLPRFGEGEGKGDGGSGGEGSAVGLRQRMAVLADRRVTSIVTVSFLAAVASLGLYTYLAPVMAARPMGEVDGITPYLWAWGIGGVAGSVLVGPLVDRLRRPYAVVTGIGLLLVLALAALRPAASLSPLLALVPIALWGAVGWALQVPQQHDLIAAQGAGGGPVAVALNESALYLGSAVGSGLGGLAFGLGWDASVLPWFAAAFAALALLVHLTWVRATTARHAERTGEPCRAEV